MWSVLIRNIDSVKVKICEIQGACSYEGWEALLRSIASLSNDVYDFKIAIHTARLWALLPPLLTEALLL